MTTMVKASSVDIYSYEKPKDFGEKKDVENSFLKDSLNPNLRRFQKYLDKKKLLLSKTKKESFPIKEIYLLLADIENAYEKLVCSPLRV